MDEMKNPVGRPSIPAFQRKASFGLRVDQLDRLRAEAKNRQISIASLLRHIVDWYFKSLDVKREEIVRQIDAPEAVAAK